MPNPPSPPNKAALCHEIGKMDGHIISEVVLFGTCLVFLMNFPGNNVKDKMFSTLKANLHTVDPPTSLENCHFENSKKLLSKCQMNQLPTNFELSSLKVPAHNQD